MAPTVSVRPTINRSHRMYHLRYEPGPLGIKAFDSTIAALAYPDRFSNLDTTYVTTPSSTADQFGFFHYPNYTQSALDLFVATKGEYSLGQENSIAAPYALNRTGFTKPVFVVTGEHDAPYCRSYTFSSEKE
jgi:hypothetical protein